MNILHVYAKKSLRRNPSRTAVTVIGIILSAAMLSAVTSMAASIQAYGIAYESAMLGDWHVSVKNVDQEKMQELTEDARVSEIYELRSIGYAYLEDSENFYKPYLCIQAMNEGFAEHMPITVTEGRMPEREGEVLIPAHVTDNAGVTVELGEVLSLGVGVRENEQGEQLWQEHMLSATEHGDGTVTPQEKLTGCEQKRYTVVGFYDRPTFENYSAPGYTVLTVASDGEDYRNTDSYIVMKHPKDATVLWNEVSQEEKYLTVCNNPLLRFYGVSVRSDFNMIVYGMGSILIVIIVVGSIALIYNAFAISVSERTKQFGILSSVGATKKQMKKMVGYEAYLLCLIGVPIGIFFGNCGIGITLYCFRRSLTYLVGGIDGVEWKLCVSPAAVIAAAVIGVFTVLISAYLPMRRALKGSAIDAIRQRSDIKLTAKELKLPRWVGKSFGVEGIIAWKNFKRNRKRYRATVISLSLSILLFLSAGSFSDYLFGSYRNEVKLSSFDVGVEIYEDSYDEIMQDESTIRGIKGVAVVYECMESWLDIAFDSEELTKEAESYYQDRGEESYNVKAIFLQDDIYEEMISFYGLDSEKYRDETEPKAIVLNRIHDYLDGEDYELSVLRQSCESITGNGEIAIGDIVENQITVQPEFSEKVLYWPGYFYNMELIYPISRAERVSEYLRLSEHDNGIRVTWRLKAADHTGTVQTILQLLGEDGVSVYDMAEEEEQHRMLMLMINVFSYGYITLISLISAANVFNTISTNIRLRKREFAMLKSMGMTQRGFTRMLNLECIIYGTKGLGFGLLLAVPCVVLMYYFGNGRDLAGFYLPWRYVVISAVCVFAVVYATMCYGKNRTKKEEIMDALREE